MMAAMKILTAAEMQACDVATSDRFGIAPGRLMRSASEAVVRFARFRYPHARSITVLCGRGNNGGDGLHAARLFALAGCSATVLLLGDPEGLKPEPAEAWRLLTANPTLATVHVIRSAGELAAHDGALDADLILDAIVGTGFRPPLRELPLAALEWMQAAASLSHSPVLSVDLPSGWDADSTATAPVGPVFPSDAVITFTAPKPAHVLCPLTRRWNQPVVVAPIGSPEAAVDSALQLHWSGSSKAITEPLRAFDANKGKFGHVLVVGGAVGKSGAPAMASLAALRSGAGLVTAAVPGAILPLVAGMAPELMTHPLAVDGAGELAGMSAEAISELLQKDTVLALGPGLGTSPAARALVFGLLAASRIPAVLDADALNMLAAEPERLKELASGRTLVLTPHPGEMARLTGLSIAEIQGNRLSVARDFATRFGLILVLKGARTLIAHPDGTVAVNTSGNPAMAKGGLGDLLTGLVAGLLAQYGDTPGEAVEAAVYLHGLAGDLALSQMDQHTLLATDLIPRFSQAFRYRPQALSGYCWLQGLPAEEISAAHL